MKLGGDSQLAIAPEGSHTRIPAFSGEFLPRGKSRVSHYVPPHDQRTANGSLCAAHSLTGDMFHIKRDSPSHSTISPTQAAHRIVKRCQFSSHRVISCPQYTEMSNRCSQLMSLEYPLPTLDSLSANLTSMRISALAGEVSTSQPTNGHGFSARGAATTSGVGSGSRGSASLGPAAHSSERSEHPTQDS
jgi:hypothetical protein